MSFGIDAQLSALNASRYFNFDGVIDVDAAFNASSRQFCVAGTALLAAAAIAAMRFKAPRQVVTAGMLTGIAASAFALPSVHKLPPVAARPEAAYLMPFDAR